MASTTTTRQRTREESHDHRPSPSMLVSHSFPETRRPWTPPSMIPPPPAMHRTVGLQLVLLHADMLLTLLVDSQRHTNVIVIFLYFVQYMMLAFNTVMLLVRFTQTYPFRAGMIGLLFSEFRGHLIAILAHHVALLGCRGVGVIEVLKCHGSVCDVWSGRYYAAYVVSRLTMVPMYYAFKRATTRLCNPRYYMDCAWFRDRMRERGYDA